MGLVMNEMEETKSTGTHDSKKTKQIANSIADISDDQIKLIGDNIGHISKSIDLIANFCKIGENTKQFFAKEIGKKIGDTPAKLAIAQAFYSMIVHTPAIYGRKTIEDKDCIIYQKINIEDTGKDNGRCLENKRDKHMKTYYQMHSLLYGLIDRPRNTIFIKDRNGEKQVCGIDIDSNRYGFFAFNKACLPSYKEDENCQYNGNNFLHAKRSRLEIVNEECKKLANFDYEEFLHRCVMNFKHLNIEKDPETWRTFKAFLDAACNYKKALSDCFNENYVKEKSEKRCIVKLKDFFAGYGCEYKAPAKVQEAIQKDFNNFNTFISKLGKLWELNENNNPCEKSINKIIEHYGENYSKTHPKSNVINGQSSLNYRIFHSCTSPNANYH